MQSDADKAFRMVLSAAEMERVKEAVVVAEIMRLTGLNERDACREFNRAMFCRSWQ